MADESITILIPTRHRADYLAVAVESIKTAAEEAARRRRLRTRILVIDDAPETDESLEVTKRLGVDYLRVQEHDGLKDPGAAIVLGVRNVDTQLQCIFGDDDVMLPGYLTAALAVRDEGYDVVSSSFELTNEDLVPFRTVTLAPAALGDLLAGYTGVNDGSLVEHDLVKDLEWDVTLEGQMLVPIWAELMLMGKSFGAVPHPTWWYRRHDENISYAARSEKDLVLRASAQARMRARVLEVLGEIPPSPMEAFEAKQRARRAELAALQTRPQLRIPHLPRAPRSLPGRPR